MQTKIFSDTSVRPGRRRFRHTPPLSEVWSNLNNLPWPAESSASVDAVQAAVPPDLRLRGATGGGKASSFTTVAQGTTIGQDAKQRWPSYFPSVLLSQELSWRMEPIAGTMTWSP